MELLWWHWVAAGMALMGLELFITSFTIIWFGLGAALTGAVLYFAPGMTVASQVFLWAVSSIAFTVIWFKVINPQIKNKSLSGMAKEAIMGQTGLVVKAPSEGVRGRVRFSIPLLGAEEWEFITEDEITEGDRIMVQGHSGNTLIVKRS